MWSGLQNLRESQMSITLKRNSTSVSLQFDRNPICIVFYQRDVPDEMRTPWKLHVHASRFRRILFSETESSCVSQDLVVYRQTVMYTCDPELLLDLVTDARPCMCCMAQAAESNKSSSCACTFAQWSPPVDPANTHTRTPQSRRTSAVISLIDHSDNYSQL